MPHGVLPDREERGFDAVRGERREHGRRIIRPRPVVERQHDLLRTQEIEILEMLEAEAGAASGIDLDDASESKRIRLRFNLTALPSMRSSDAKVVGKQLELGFELMPIRNSILVSRT